MVKEIKKGRKYIFNFNKELERENVKDIMSSFEYRRLEHSFFVNESVELEELLGKSCYLIITEKNESIIVKNYILDYLDVVPQVIQEQLDI